MDTLQEIATMFALFVAGLCLWGLTYFIPRRVQSGGSPPPPGFLGKYPNDVVDDLHGIHTLVSQHLAGQTPTEEELVEAGRQMARFFTHLEWKFRGRPNTLWPSTERTDFYLCASGLALLGHSNHLGWPIVSAIRRRVAKPLSKRAQGEPQLVHVALAGVAPAVAASNEDEADRLLDLLPSPSVAETQALRWVNELCVHGNTAACSVARRRGNAVVQTPWRNDDPLTPRQRWAISSCIYPSYAFDSRIHLAENNGLTPVQHRAHLLDWWEVDDAQSALHVLRGLQEGRVGRGPELTRDLAALREEDVDARSCFLKKHRKTLAQTKLRAWDLCFMQQVARSSVALGYLDEDEGWSWVFAAREELAAVYSSWDAMADDYLLGMAHFYVDNEDGDSGYHDGLVDFLKTSPDSPWRDIPWAAPELD